LELQQLDAVLDPIFFYLMGLHSVYLQQAQQVTVKWCEFGCIGSVTALWALLYLFKLSPPVFFPDSAMPVSGLLSLVSVVLNLSDLFLALLVLV
jgi:hypothetical protein